jgi:probable rRNA maturation factor
LKIKFYYDKIKFRLRDTATIRKFLDKVIREEKLIPGDLNFIFTDDAEILKINNEFLDHNYFTDVISFGENAGDIVNGEIYISIDTVRNNAREFNTDIREEVIRVMVHGVLHLCGYDDMNEKDRDAMMKRQENRVVEFRRSGIWNSDTK